ncbi:putative small nucleolar ribonucleoprotein complex component protein [Eutypa lata UCREL1]|uniref:Putative small nucleolar ribonucleoprotein complex component protein n=1 Tax=Eutypa lata (strain UCR-EL1) TaxID=1287681 RepID=M7T1K0_EUTLA|nr:putative small nucleolar ribonucleoprotein complex component protein [Eutypa lata UCREL1]
MSTKRKPPTKIAQPVVKQSAKKPTKTHINEADTAVSAPTISSKTGSEPNEEVIEISSDSGSSEYEQSDEEDQGKGEPSAASNGTTQHTEVADGHNAPRNTRSIAADENGDVDMDMPSPNQPTDGESDQELAAPTFGDLVRANETIDVPSALSAQQSSALAAPGRVVAPPSSSSLGTVLTQALRTDDTDLLESCLHTTDLATVRNTIQRLDSTLAGTLLTKLASRMHRRPGRAGSLMTWVQWTLIAHGGALAMQPGLTKKLSELHRVLEERSRGLNSLLALKGKLDLLDAQMQLRRGMQHNIDSDSDAEEDGEEGVVYVEGEDSDAEMINGDIGADDDDLVVTNGIVDMDDESDEEESSEGEEDEEQLEGEDEIDENEVDHEDVESEEEESEPEAVPPSKRSRTTQSARRTR